MAKLGEVCKVSPSTKNIERQGAWLLNLDMVEQQTGRVIEYKYVGEDDLNGSIIQFDTENVLYSKLRPNLNKVVLPQKDGFSTSELLPLRPDARVLNRDYLAVFLRSDSFVTWAVSKTAGAKMPRLGTKDLMNAEIPVPTIEQQKKIAEKFKKLEQLIFLRKQQLAKLDELVKARFVEMFGDAKLNPNNLPCCSLSEYIVFLTSGSRGWSQYFTDSGEYFITIKNVKNCKITLQDVQCVTPPDNAEAKRTRVQENDLLISITADLGRTGIVTKKIAEHGAYINQHLTCIRLKQDKLNPLYVAYYMESDAGKEQFIAKNQSAVKAGLNFNAINSLKLMVPPLALQNQFAAFVERVDKQKQTVQQSLEKLELMKKALMQEYFG